MNRIMRISSNLALQVRLQASSTKAEDVRMVTKSREDPNAAETSPARDLAASGTAPTSTAATSAETSEAQGSDVAPRTASNTLQARSDI